MVCVIDFKHFDLAAAVQLEDGTGQKTSRPKAAHLSRVDDIYLIFSRMTHNITITEKTAIQLAAQETCL